VTVVSLSLRSALRSQVSEAITNS